jgi:hypothetical protein
MLWCWEGGREALEALSLLGVKDGDCITVEVPFQNTCHRIEGVLIFMA